MKALRIDKTDGGTTAAIADFDEADLMPGNVTVCVSHSTVNYKDGLAITGKNPVVRVSPMIGGIDFAGTVETSEDSEFKPGDRVVCNGWGLSETHFGGYAEKARVKGEWLVKLPDSISTHEAMAVGTAGYTAMLSVLALEAHGLDPAQGPAIVTGAAGGVGSFALMLLKTAGWHCIASTGTRGRGGLSETARRRRDHRPCGPVRARQAVWQGTLGRRRRFGRLAYAGQSAGADQAAWRDRRLWPRPGHGPVDFGRAVHPPWRRASWHR